MRKILAVAAVAVIASATMAVLAVAGGSAWHRNTPTPSTTAVTTVEYETEDWGTGTAALFITPVPECGSDEGRDVPVPCIWAQPDPRVARVAYAQVADGEYVATLIRDVPACLGGESDPRPWSTAGGTVPMCYWDQGARGSVLGEGTGRYLIVESV